jgi:hypothetical protein
MSFAIPLWVGLTVVLAGALAMLLWFLVTDQSWELTLAATFATLSFGILAMLLNHVSQGEERIAKETSEEDR